MNPKPILSTNLEAVLHQIHVSFFFFLYRCPFFESINIYIIIDYEDQQIDSNDLDKDSILNSKFNQEDLQVLIINIY